MPLQIIPQPQPTGLDALGQAITGGARDYANITLQQQYLDRLRQQQLADSDTKRQEQLSDAALRRTQQLADVAESERYTTQRDSDQEKARQSNDLATRRHQALMVLYNAGLLAISDFENEAAIQAAFKKASQNGLVDRTKNILQAPDLSITNPDGSHPPLITVDDLHDQTKLDAATNKYDKQQSDLAARQLSLTNTSQTNAQATADSLQKRIGELSRKADALEADIPDEQLVPQPTPTQIRNDAQQLVLSQNGGKPPKDMEQAIQAAIPEALKNLQIMAAQLANARKQQRHEQALVLRSQVQVDSSQLGELYRQKIYPTPGATTGDDFGNADTSIPGPAPAGAQPVDRAAAQKSAMQAVLDAARRISPASVKPAAPGENTPLQDPTGADPLIAQANQQRAQASYKSSVLDPLTSAATQLQQIDQEIQRQQHPESFTMYGQPATDANKAFLGDPNVMTLYGQPQTNIQGRAAALSNLYAKRQAVVQQIATLKQRVQAPAIQAPVAPTAATTAPSAPAFSGATESVPFSSIPSSTPWWGGSSRSALPVLMDQ